MTPTRAMNPLSVGVPREVKGGEHRVAITPDGVHELAAGGVSVLVEAGAGAGSSISDDDYHRAGADVQTDGNQASILSRKASTRVLIWPTSSWL